MLNNKRIISLLLIIILYNVILEGKAGQYSHNLSSLNVNNFEIKSIQEKDVILKAHTDTIEIKLPYAYIKNRQLKGIIDEIKITDSKGKTISTPIFLYMLENQNEFFEWWLIGPYTAMDENFYKKRAIGFYKIGQIYVIIDYSAKRNIKILPKVESRFRLITENLQQIFNVEPIFELDVKSPKIEAPTLRIDDYEINWFKQYKVE